MRPPIDTPPRHLLGRGVALLLAALVAMIVIVTLLTARARATLDDLRRADRINTALAAMNQVLVDLLNAETGQRGYLLTQRPGYLQPYRDAMRQLEQRLDELPERDDDPAHAPRLARVRELALLKGQEMAQTLRLHDSGRHDEALDLVMSDQGRRRMDELRDTLGELIAELRAERAVIAERQARGAGQAELLLLAALAALSLFTVLALTQVVLRTRQVARTERRLRGIADHMPALISQFDRQQRWTFANAEVGRLYGLDPRLLEGRTVAEMRGADDAERVAPYVERVLSGVPVEFDAPQRIDGEPRHFHYRLAPAREGGRANGRVEGFYAVALDITERQLDQEKLAVSERRIKALTDNLPVLITYVDAQLRLRYANETLRAWMGLDPQAVLGQPIEQLMGRELFDQRRAQLALTLQGERVEFEIVSVMRGQQRHIKNIYVPDVAVDGRVVGLYALGIDISVMKQAEAQLTRLASSDALTGLPNRREFDQALLGALARQRRLAHEGRFLALLFLDVDRFKTINDTHGHGVGDAVLSEFATCLRRHVRASDLVARVAGDEFAAVLEGLNDPAEAEQVALKIVEAVRAARLGGREVTVSVGIATLGDGEAPPLELMAMADRALYQAKRRGRDGLAALHWPHGAARQ